MFHYLRREAGFYRRLVRLALPLVLQNLITTSLGFVDTFMVGLLGQDELSAVTAANTPVFLVQIIILGLISGLTVLVSQYWGKGDVEAINRCMGTALYAGLSISGIVALALLLFPGGVMALVTDNARLVELGAPYLRIVGVSYVFNAASSVYVGMQRSTEKPVMGMTIFAVSMLLNTLLNYILIFGKFGAPALGVTGAAVATLTSRVVEFLITLVCALCSRHVPLLPAAILRPGGAIWRDFAKYSAPVLVNEMLWGLGVSVMTAIMGHMAISAEMLAAYAVMGNIEKFATVACFGVAGAASVMVGKRIGEGADQEEVYSLACCLLLVSVLVGGDGIPGAGGAAAHGVHPLCLPPVPSGGAVFARGVHHGRGAHLHDAHQGHGHHQHHRPPPGRRRRPDGLPHRPLLPVGHRRAPGFRHRPGAGRPGGGGVLRHPV